MKIVILDGYAENPGDLSWEGFSSLGQLSVYDRTPQEKIIERIGDSEIVLTNKTPIDATTIAACKNMRYIGVLATGYNVIDIVAAGEHGIAVTNVPAYGTEAVAQFAIAMLLSICHHVEYHAQQVRQGKWEQKNEWCFWDYPLIELKDKTMGILGFGRIGQATGRIAKALGMRVLAHDAFESEQGKALATYVGLEELLSCSDVIALHCPLTEETHGIICDRTIQQMKDGVILLNNSRGGLIVEQDLADALRSGKVYAAAVDVVSTEPIHNDNPLLSAPNCLVTPHISWAPKEARQRLMDIAVQNLADFLLGKSTNRIC